MSDDSWELSFTENKIIEFKEAFLDMTKTLQGIVKTDTWTSTPEYQSKFVANRCLIRNKKVIKEIEECQMN